MEENVSKRVAFLLRSKDFSGTKMAAMMGMPQGTFSNKLLGKRRFKIGELQKILEIFPEVSDTWLLTGKGSIERGENGGCAADCQGVPYYDIDFKGGFETMYNDESETPESYIAVPGFSLATCWCNVSGHSMEPEICHGDIIALQRINDTSFLPFGDIYAIVTQNGMRTVKRLGPAADNGSYSLIPANRSPEYGIQEIRRSEISAVFRVVGKISRF